jgi:hypothetical protein
MMVREAFRTNLRRAAVEMLEAYKAESGVELQIYPGRPASFYPPTAFVDGIRERIELLGPKRRQRIPVVTVVVVHGLFDSANTAAAGDAFVDGFLEFTLDQYHAAGANTLLAITATLDLPTYVPEWLPPDRHRQFYATSLALEGLAID